MPLSITSSLSNSKSFYMDTEWALLDKSVVFSMSPMLHKVFLTDFCFREERARDRVSKRKRETSIWEKHRSVVSCTPPTGDQTHNLSKCPNRELNSHPVGVQDDAPTTWAAMPGLFYKVYEEHGHNHLYC